VYGATRQREDSLLSSGSLDLLEVALAFSLKNTPVVHSKPGHFGSGGLQADLLRDVLLPVVDARGER